MLPIRVGSKQLIREINQALVLNAVRAGGALSRTEIAQRTGLSMPTISDITAELIESELLYEGATGVSTGGRKPVLLALNAQAGYAIGVKLTEELLTAVLTDLDATVVARESAPVTGHTPEQIADALATVVRALVPAANGRPVFGVGVGMAGVIDRDRNLVRHATYFGWRNLPFGQLLEGRLDLPVIVDNDVNALTAAEQWFGSGRGVADFVVISIGRGVGLGMVLDGRLYRGSRGGAGEFGHTTVVPDGPLCACGKRGCLEALISDIAIAQRAATALGHEVAVHEAVDGALGGDAALQSIFAAAGRTLGLAVANLVNVLNPAMVIISGEGVRAGELVTAPFRRALREHCFDGLDDDLAVVTEPWGDEAWARGAASLLLGELFQPAIRQGDEERPSLTTRSAT
ncbi:MAG TPA: ROK family transcriptional regulator [Chloroflexaceae bacterium]|nr:ROK family transcriptional regulator [Chloroflexaceae bacterium]